MLTDAAKRNVRVLIVENDPDDSELEVDCLQQAGFQVDWKRVESAAQMTEALHEGGWDAIISDFLMPGFTGLEALQIAQQFGLDIPFIIVSGSIGEDLAVQAMRAGAHDYLMKDRMARLGAALERELRETEVRKEQKRIAAENVRQAEELRLQATQLARTNLELERFAYLAAHDLQEPLRMVAAYSELLVKRYRPANNDDIERILSFITSGIDRMETLIKGLLAYSTTLLDDPPVLCPVRVDTVVERTRDALKQQLEQTKAEVVWSAMSTVFADASKLLTIFEQLFSNALTFSKPGEPPRIEVTARETADAVVIGVKDNGIGIDRQYWEQIFGLFKRLHRDDARGLGMGLALCRRLLEQQGGRIWVESEVGLGTTVFFTLKAASEC